MGSRPITAFEPQQSAYHDNTSHSFQQTCRSLWRLKHLHYKPIHTNLNKPGDNEEGSGVPERTL